MFRFGKGPEAPPLVETPEEPAEKEKPQRRYLITLHFWGGGAPLGPTRMEVSEQTRRKMAERAVEVVGADGYELTQTGIKVFFRGKKASSERRAVLFGKIQGVKIEEVFPLSLVLDSRRGDYGVEAIPYIDN